MKELDITDIEATLLIESKALNKNLKVDEFKIIYAPTYRWIPEDESSMVNMFLDNIESINKILEEINGTFTLRLHPHTWRNYEENNIISVSSFIADGLH